MMNLQTDQPDLFAVEETLSPFAKWKREHHVETEFEDDGDSGDWVAILVTADGEGFVLGYGDTEQGACLDLAMELNIPHWLEGQAL